MKIGFFHDHIFTKHGSTVHTSGTLASQVWDRFFDAGASEVIVCGRFSENVKLGPIAERENVSFIFSEDLSNLSSLLLNANCAEVKKAVLASDIVVARLPSEIGFKAIKEAKKQNKKVICEVVACPFDGLSYHGGKAAKLYAPIIKKRMKYWVNQCDGALYVTEKALQARYPCNGYISNASNVEINSVVDNSFLHTRYERFLLSSNSSEIKIGLIGTMLNDSKGIDIAIKALSGIDGVNLHILGTGESSRFKELAKKKNVNFYYDGFKSNKQDVFEWLDGIDIYIQPSFQEGLPRATIEAMSRGCPVITSDAGGLAELTLSSFIHSSGDYLKLRADLIRLLNDKSLHETSSEHSLATAEKYLGATLKQKRADFYSHFIIS